jgi:hypothetical protein
MKGFIDRLADILRAAMGSAEDAPRGTSAGTGPRAGTGADSSRFHDPDVQAAWEELDSFMNEGRGDAGDRRRGSARDAGTRRGPDETLRQDYANLEVPFGADMDTVRRSYKRLILRYHPDKHSASPEAQRVALEISKKINASFERIRAQRER